MALSDGDQWPSRTFIDTFFEFQVKKFGYDKWSWIIAEIKHAKKSSFSTLLLKKIALNFLHVFDNYSKKSFKNSPKILDNLNNLKLEKKF